LYDTEATDMSEAINNLLRHSRVPLVVLLATLSSHPALAQVDISGMWRPLPRNQDGSGMTGDAAGLPLSSENKWRRDSWSPDDFDVPEWVCRPHSWDYGLEGPVSQLRFWPEIDQASQRIIAYHGHLSFDDQETTIWMDGRPRPPANALHTWSGFSTGEWEGSVLVVTTTHLKEAYIRRTGPMRSDQAIVRTRWRRIGDYLQATSILYDPIYLTEPYIRSTMMWASDPSTPMNTWPCEEATETAVPPGKVPHYLPGKSPLPGLDPNLADRFETPFEARQGGAETMYPEYIAKMRTMPRPTVKAPVGSGGSPP
jgi:hypothetical protein